MEYSLFNQMLWSGFFLGVEAERYAAATGADAREVLRRVVAGELTIAPSVSRPDITPTGVVAEDRANYEMALRRVAESAGNMGRRILEFDELLAKGLL